MWTCAWRRGEDTPEANETGLHPFFAFSGGLALWNEVFINTSDTASETVHAVLTGAGRMAVSSAVLAVAAVYIGKGIVITAKFFAKRWPRP